MDIQIKFEALQNMLSFEVGEEHEDPLSWLMSLVSEFVAARRVSLMLLDSEGDKGKRLKLVALHGNLPSSAWNEKPKLGEGIAAKVLAEGQSQVIADINTSQLKTARRHPGESASFIACPIPIFGQMAGVLNISDGTSGVPFASQDLARAELSATVVGRSVQLLRMRGMLDSSFAKMAMVRAGILDSSTFIALSTTEPQKVAKILAKSFYKEMHRCGFTNNQIIHAASEIISELTLNMNRHRNRQKRQEH